MRKAKLNVVDELKSTAKPAETIKITPPNFLYANVRIDGTAPFVSNNMSQRARDAMEAAQREGTQARRKVRKRPPKDFDAAFIGAQHISTEGWCGIPCAAFRAAMISACRTVDFTMVRAKLSLFVEPDGFDRDTGQPLTRIYGEPHPFKMTVRLASGATDLACRPKWDKWYCVIRLKFDADSFSASDVLNLLARAGEHCGVGAGRADSKESAGIGFGFFKVAGIEAERPKIAAAKAPRGSVRRSRTE